MPVVLTTGHALYKQIAPDVAINRLVQLVSRDAFNLEPSRSIMVLGQETFAQPYFGDLRTTWGVLGLETFAQRMVKVERDS